jgi:hypothetical protein
MARDHYVPQFYLRNFQIANQPGLVYSYQRKRSPKPKAIRTAAQEEDYYDLKRNDPSVDKDGVDKLLGMSEDKSSKAITQLLTSSSFSLVGADVGYLSWFIGLLVARTPFLREQLVSIQTALANRDIRKMLRDEEEFKKLVEAHPETDIQMLENARKGFLEGALNLEFLRGGETEDFFMAGQLQFAEIIVDLLQRKYWTLIETNNSRPFLTSDNPVVIMPTIHHTPDMHFGYVDGKILLPLSPKRALMFTNEPWGRGGIVYIHETKMEEFQFYTITQCHRSVFSHIKSDEFQAVLDST